MSDLISLKLLKRSTRFLSSVRNISLIFFVAFFIKDIQTPVLAQSVPEHIYVGQTALGIDTGADPANAHSINWLNNAGNWTLLSEIDGKVGPGDTVHLVGTITSNVGIPADGAPGSPVNILFESGAVLSNSNIKLSNRKFIVIDGGVNGAIKNINSYKGYGVFVTNSSWIEIRNMNIDFDEQLQMTSGIYVLSKDSLFSNNIFIHDNFITGRQNLPIKSIGIWVIAGQDQSSLNVQIYSNTIINTQYGVEVNFLNDSPAGSVKIYNNTITDFHSGSIQFSGASGSSLMGIVEIFNNTLKSGVTYGATFMDIRDYESVLPSTLYNNTLQTTSITAKVGCFMVLSIAANIKILNNTMTMAEGGVSKGVCLNKVSLVGIFNNIISNTGQPLYFYEQASADSTVSDYNIFYNFTGGIQVSFSNYSFATWKGTGHDTNSLSVNPKLSASLTIADGTSPAIDSGANASAYLQKDKDGVIRPQNSGWDIGAYEYSGIVAPPATAGVEHIYVSQASLGSGLGTNITNTRSLSWVNDVSNWSTQTLIDGKVGPGDTVHLVGTFTSRLIVAESGSPSLPIIFLFEKDAQFFVTNPWVWVTGSIHIAGKNYIVVDGGINGKIVTTLNTPQSTFPSNGITIDVSHSVEIKNLYITSYITPQSSGVKHGVNNGIYPSSSSNINIHDNVINNARQGIHYSFAPQPSALKDTIKIYNNTISDTISGIYFQYGESSDIAYEIYNNKITDFISVGIAVRSANINSNSYTKSFKIYNNEIKNGIDNGQIQTFIKSWIHIEYFNGFNSYTGSNIDTLVFNNVLSATSANISTVDFIKLVDVSGIKLFNNTIIGYGVGSGIKVITGLSAGLSTGNTGVKQAQFFNNIISSVANPFDFLDATFLGQITSNHNLFYNYTGGVKVGAVTYTIPQWQAQNKDSNSLITNPFLSVDQKLNSNSTAIDSGNNQSVYFTLDRDGTTRPFGSAWDIGAYEYTGVVSPPPPPLDTTAPVISSGSPAGTLAVGVTSAILSFTTNESAVCRFGDDTLGIPYDSLTLNASTVNGTTHTATVNNLSPDTWQYFIRCLDSVGNKNNTDYIIGFLIPQAPPIIPPPPGGGGGGGGGGPPPGPDVLPPIISNEFPNGLFPLPTTAISTIFSVNTDESASCKYSDKADTPYDLMAKNFASANSLFHSTILKNLFPGTWKLYVRCSDNLNNTNTLDYPIVFTISFPATGGGGTPKLQGPCIKWTRWLGLGSKGEDVKRLQVYFNANGYTVATVGPGSPGNETTTFGLLTENAVKKFQCARLKICSGSPSTNGYGAVGPRTRAVLNLNICPVKFQEL